MNKFPAALATILLSSAVALAQNAPPASAAPPVSANAVPSASVTLTGGAVAAGVGYVWGRGTLDYHGHQHRFKLNGLSVVDVGAAHITATGEVFNLSRLRDFSGNYVAAAAGATVAGGAGVAYLKNEHGVIIKLHSTTVGLRFTLSADGVNIRLRRK